ncbi:MAG TPA: SHOCT domain-containing protein [Solirubrobacterales bacterium]|nr:SHOCT domain-containing protein [Solirubrobacterales bacterium]
MECICGCGEPVPRGMIEVNLRLGEISVELLAWDKYRTMNRLDPDDFVATERLIDRGAGVHRRLLTALHEKVEDVSPAESADWLAESRSSWQGREEMTERGSFLRGRKLRLTKEDLARIDRVHPDRTYSGDPDDTAGEGVTGDPGAAVTGAGQLERLRSLRAEGILTEEEFRAAEARLGNARPR